MRLQHTSLMSCTPILFSPSMCWIRCTTLGIRLRPLASFLNVLFHGGMWIVQPLLKKRVPPFLGFDGIVDTSTVWRLFDEHVAVLAAP